MRILITGTAGFIGYHLTQTILNNGFEVLGIDNINDYYDVNLKYNRLQTLGIPKDSIHPNSICTSHKWSQLQFVQTDLHNKEQIFQYFQQFKPHIVINLAAQAGVRYSFEQPYTYIDSNIIGFLNILEACRSFPVQHLLYASSSSVYGLNKNIPFSIEDSVDYPISLYAATKKSNELMAHTYSYLFQIPTTGLRFFTVYGPWGRPDMALFKFTQNILANKPIEVYNYGQMYRDFTYIDDIVSAIIQLINIPPLSQSHTATPAPYRLLNIGNGNPVKLMDFVEAIEQELNKKATIHFLPLQPGDVVSTHADTHHLWELIKFKPNTNIKQGIKAFIQWYKNYYQI